MMLRLVLSAALLWGGGESVGVTCRDANNGEVDWYILYKSPKTDLLDGAKYLYINADGVATRHQNIAGPESALGRTLKPILRPIRSMEADFGFLSYSDQPPGSNAHKTFGHSKGLLMVTRGGTGVWISHSTPQFPFRRDQNHFWPPSGFTNAQTFICITVNYEQFRTIGRHLQHIRAFPFEHDIPESFHQELKDAVNWVELPPPTAGFPNLLSRGGDRFELIPKQSSEEQEVGDLYATISSRVGSDLLVKTWGCQPKKARCDSESLRDVRVVRTSMGEWKDTSDHSKWCVSVDQNKPWVCVADVNRAQSQYQRYGGAVCVHKEAIHTTFKGFIKRKDNCRKRTRMDDNVPEIDSSDGLFSCEDSV